MFKNVKKEEITIPAQMSYLIQVRDFVEHIGKRHKFDDKIVNSFKLVIDEACTNIVRHGYRDIKNGEITIKAVIRRLSLTIIIVDQGQSYDPRQANTPDLAKYVDIGKRGGLGILMMRKLMDDLHYSVTERGNEFRLTKYREALHESALSRRWNTLNMKSQYSIIATILYTVIALIIFIPIYLGTESEVVDNSLNTTASKTEDLAVNLRDDLLDETSMTISEKAHSLYNSEPRIVDEVLVIGDDQRRKGWATEKFYSYSDEYTIPETAVLIDTISATRVYQYVKNDTLIYDLETDILLGIGTQLGKVHVWIKDDTLTELINAKKLRMIIFLVIILLVGYVPIFLLIHKLLSTFHNLAEWVREVVHGKVDQDEIDIDASDEIGEIAQAFNEMTHKFREAQVTLIEQQKLQKELQVAQEIQQMLLPSDFPKVEGYDISSYYEAAKEVGGDLFDFVEIDEDAVGIIVADVSGKGIPGSLIMTMIRTAIRLESRGNRNPADVLARVNRFVANDMKRGMFVTMFYIILDSRNRLIHYASAGHNPMILYRGSTDQTYYLNPSGFPVGLQLPDIDLFAKKIESESIQLKEDDILVSYTDGITEAMNNERELYHEERFLHAIRSNSHLDVGEFVKSINGHLKDFTGGAPQNDDITYVAIKEKMGFGEVQFKLVEEMLSQIKNGMKVKDAQERFKIPPKLYYEYKEIVKRKGMPGLLKYLENKDIVETKHLSIEVKTKIFDIIGKHPDYGPKLISYELRTDEYGNVKIDPDRIYEALVKLRLNTQKLRERYLQKDGKKRIKQPGTPLLTLDGQVILNFKSSEEEVAKRRGAEAEITSKTLKPEVEEERTAHRISLSTDDKPESGTYMHQQARPFKPAPAPPKPEEEIEKKPPKKREEVTPKPAPQVSQPITKDELIKQVSPDVDPKVYKEFCRLVSTDLDAVYDLMNNIGVSKQPEDDAKKINRLIKLILKHPKLKDSDYVKQIFGQVQKITDTVELNITDLSQEDISSNYKELLIYISKDYKFKDYKKLYEIINKIGLIDLRLKKSASAKGAQNGDNYDQIRDKLVRKGIITDTALLDSLEKEKKQ